MLNERQRVDIMQKIDFGEIDGYGDPNLGRYFLDNGYWERVIDSKVFFVIGRKGTGKSSIYRIIEEQSVINGAIVANKDFGDFPFEKLLRLSDDDFTTPNQYQSVWRNLILNIFASMIAKQEVTGNIHYDEIKKYVTACLGDVTELHKEIVNYTSKTGTGLTFRGINASNESSKSLTLGHGNNNVTQINSRLFELILSFLITCNKDTYYIIQFDRLDDNYNQYQNIEQYYQAIISLFKVTYSINQDFRRKNINNAKIILYLRSDIFRELGTRDSESARWDDYKTIINWAITNRDDWENPPLLQMINKRISTSLQNEYATMNYSKIFDSKSIDLKNQRDGRQDLLQYMVDRTLHRPRDLIQFCKYIQDEVCITERFYFRTIINAETKYAYWLVNSELSNEINPILKSTAATAAVYEMLKLLGTRAFSLSDFYDRYRSVKGIPMDSEELAYFLYDVGIIQNIDLGKSPPHIRSIVRNEGKLDRNHKMIIHQGVWKGLNA